MLTANPLTAKRRLNVGDVGKRWGDKTVRGGDAYLPFCPNSDRDSPGLKRPIGGNPPYFATNSEEGARMQMV